MQLKGSKHLINLSIDSIILKWIIKIQVEDAGWICVAQDGIPIKVLVNTTMTF